VVVVGCALLVNVIVALTAPVVVGVKVTVNETLLPAAIVTGSESPLTWNAELLVLTAVTVTLAPLAESVPDVVPLVPTTTLPTASVVGLTLSCPTAAVAVPDNGMVRVGFDAFDVIVTVPLKVPAVVGVNVTVNVVLAPAVSVTGVVIPLRLKPVPLIVT
jgi:hypothetical protein